MSFVEKKYLNASSPPMAEMSGFFVWPCSLGKHANHNCQLSFV
jgi:hypothetical protein